MEQGKKMIRLVKVPSERQKRDRSNKNHPSYCNGFSVATPSAVPPASFVEIKLYQAEIEYIRKMPGIEEKSKLHFILFSVRPKSG